MKPSSLPVVAIGAALVAVLVMFGIVLSWRGDVPAETTDVVAAAEPKAAATPTPDVITPDPFADTDVTTSDSSSSSEPFEGFATDSSDDTDATDDTGADPTVPAAAAGGASAEGLSLDVSGTCTKDGGTLTGEGSGFTPRKRYGLVVLQPDGSYWPDAAGKRIGADGTFPWKWDCEGVDPGLWTAILTDKATGRKLTAGFTVGS